jgi:integrase
MDWPFVFHLDGRNADHFRKAWSTSCAMIGKPGLLFHDLRRSAIRNMVRAGIPERVAMTISGHEMRNVFNRYNITSQDIYWKRPESAMNSSSCKPDGYNLVTIGPKTGKGSQP